MTFQWLQLRITEEKDRRELEGRTIARLPGALEELYRHLAVCVHAYQEAFGPESADIHMSASRIKTTVREYLEGKWQQSAKIEVTILPSLPGFQIERGGNPILIEVGLLVGDKTFFRDRETEQYLGMEELTRRILDRGLFPKLAE